MAEFCFECYKKHFDSKARIEHLVMGKELDLCEGCGEYKPAVIKKSLIRRVLALAKRFCGGAG